MRSATRAWEGPGESYDVSAGLTRPVHLSLDADGLVLRGIDPSNRGSTIRIRRGEARSVDRMADGAIRIWLAEPAGIAVTVRGDDAAQALRSHGWIRRPLASALGDMRPLLIVSTLALIAIIAFSRLALGPLASAVARLAPPELEQELGKAMYQSIAAGEPISREPEAIGALEACVRALRQPEHTSPEAVAVIVEDSTVVNAFALPGGYVVVYRGILNRMEDESELLGVLAHEIGHVAGHHSMERLARTATTRLFTAVIMGDAGGLGTVVATQGTALLALAYDRDQEREADDYAVATLAAAGIDPGGLSRLFAKLDREEKRRGMKFPGFLSTHPPTAERVQRLDAASKPGAEARRVLSAAGWAALSRRPAPS